MPRTKRKAADRDLLSPDRLLKSTSYVLSKDIHGFLRKCMTDWDAYTEDEKLKIIETLPANYRSLEKDAQGRIKVPLDLHFIRNDPFLKKGVERLRKDIEEGFYESTWQLRGERAMQKRRDGGFEGFIHKTIQEKFGESVDERQRHDEDEMEIALKKNHTAKRGCKRSLRMDYENDQIEAYPTVAASQRETA